MAGQSLPDVAGMKLLTCEDLIAGPIKYQGLQADVTHCLFVPLDLKMVHHFRRCYIGDYACSLKGA